MELNLDIGADLGVNLRGRKPREVTVEVDGQLTEADLAALSEERGIKAQPLKRISDRHHMLARLLANGAAPGEAALATGLTVSRVSVLMGDELFLELVRHYRKHPDAVAMEMNQRLLGLGNDSADILSDRLNKDPDSFTPNQLLAILEKAADRTGHGPSSMTTDLNSASAFAERLAAAKRRLKEARDITPAPAEPELIEGESIPKECHPPGSHFNGDADGND